MLLFFRPKAVYLLNEDRAKKMPDLRHQPELHTSSFTNCPQSTLTEFFEAALKLPICLINAEVCLM
jgi:hypothetical protein